MDSQTRALVHIYTGDGKGKTSAALGLTLRAAGWGWRVLFVQFFKVEEDPSGEKELIRERIKEVELLRAEQRHPIFQQSPVSEELIGGSVRRLFEKTVRRIEEGTDFKMVVLDEVMSAINGGYLKVEKVLELIDRLCAQGVEVVLTGRNAPVELVKRADYVTEMLKIKHPFDEGIKARKGVEY